MDSDSWSDRLASASRRYQLDFLSRSDNFLGFEEVEGEDDFREEYACPFCSDYFDIVSLCCHIDKDHPMDAKNGSRQKPGGYVMLVAHNGKTFDFPFLINEFSRCSYEIPHNWLLLDSLPLAKKNMKSLEPSVKPRANLAVLGEYYNLTREGDAHRALSDVLLLSQVFQRLTIDLKLSLSDLVLRSHTASEIITAMAKNKKT